jgi:hypothetical protein
MRLQWLGQYLVLVSDCAHLAIEVGSDVPDAAPVMKAVPLSNDAAILKFCYDSQNSECQWLKAQSQLQQATRGAWPSFKVPEHQPG